MSATGKKKSSSKKSAKKKTTTKKAAVKKAGVKKTATKKKTVKKKAAAKKTAAKKAVKKPSSLEITAEERWKMIAVAAYHKAEKRNFAPGNELGDWAEAEKEIEKLLNG
jgi:hypothetical protein